MEYSRENAKKLYEENNYIKAKEIYSKLWSDSTKNGYIDKWLGWEYAKLLKRIGEIDEAISICKIIYKSYTDFKYNNDLLSWCLYEKYFKILNGSTQNKNSAQLLKIAEFIVKVTNQETGVPYENTVWKIIRLYKNPFKADLVYNWLGKLDSRKLSNKSSNIQVNDKCLELASPKEEWFYLMCKSLRELGKYKECIETCDSALLNIDKFHNDRDIWMQVEKAESLCELGLKESALNLIKQLLVKREHWVLHKTIFKIQMALGNVDEGLISAYTAALSKDPIKTKVNLYYDIGKVLEGKKEYEYALMHYILCKNIKIENNWNVSGELNNSIEKLSDIVNIGPVKLLDNLKSYWGKSKLNSANRLEGVILKILPSGKAGFIKTDKESYYFKKGSILNTKVNFVENVKVTFSLKDSFDNKKGITTKEAIDILYLEF